MKLIELRSWNRYFRKPKLFKWEEQMINNNIEI